MTAEVVVLIPMLRRPHRAAPVVASLEASTPPDVWSTLFVCSPDDRSTIDACYTTRQPVMVVNWPGGERGDYARKINAGVRVTSEPLIFLGADDLEFHEGWLPRIVACLTPGIGVVGTNDLCSKRVIAGDHSTHSLVTREYARRGTIDDPDKLLHPGYLHEFVDDELVETARVRGAYAHSDAVVEHLHPDVKKAPRDAMYAEQTNRMRRDRPLYVERQRLWTAPSLSGRSVIRSGQT